MSHVDENGALYNRIRSGDNSAIAEMIERNLPLVKSRVTLFLKDYRRFRHLRDDLISEGFLALTAAVSSFTTEDVEKPTGFIVSAIVFALSKYVDVDIGAGMMSERTVQRRRERHQPLPKQLAFDPAEPPTRLWRNASGHVVRKQICADDGFQQVNAETGMAEMPDDSFGRPAKESHPDSEQFIDSFEQADTTLKSDLLDQILACCESEKDETIVRLRIKGYTDDEIGEQIGLSRQTVNRRREAIEERFTERIKKARSD